MPCMLSAYPLDGRMNLVPLITGEAAPGPTTHRHRSGGATNRRAVSRPAGAISPDGRWLACQHGSIVAIQPLALKSSESRQRHVIQNAKLPFWSIDSRELFFVEPKTSNVMGVRLTSEPDLMVSTPVKLVDHHAMDVVKRYDHVTISVHPDGRFLYAAEPVGGPDPHLHIMLNLDTELKTKLPIEP